MDLKTTILELSGLMSVSGYEAYSRKRLIDTVGGMFDEAYGDSVGNFVMVKKCGHDNAARLLVDTHFDEIGMIVSDITDRGLLRITNIGGVDTRILAGSRVMIYGKKGDSDIKFVGIIASENSLQIRSEVKDTLKPITELLVDTGFSKDELKEMIDIGTPIGFYPVYTELSDDKIAGKGFDDKSCAACAVCAIAETPHEELAADVYLLLSSFEETSRQGGVSTAVYGIDPDYAISADVNLGATPDTKPRETVKTNGGVSITLSAVTDRRLTEMTIALASENNINYQPCVSATSTGTNSGSINLVKNGVPVVDVGLPLKNMHTCNEVIGLRDAEALRDLIKAFITSGKIAEVFKR